MKKNSKKNQKGSVLFTVICFATVLMILATTALSVSSYANRVSTTNVKSAQALITAQNCLDEYIDSFQGDYSSLTSLAGINADNPNVYDVDIAADAGTTFNPGDCKILIYKTTGGVVVKCQATYGGKTETSGSFFKTVTVNKDVNPSTLLAQGGVDLNGVATPIDGDTHIENPDVTANTQFENLDINDGSYKGNVYIENSLTINKTQISDSSKGKASTLTSKGFIYFTEQSSGTYFTTSVGKSDTSGKNSNDAGYDATKLANTDGYINTDKKLIAVKANIGSSGKPIDIYTNGAYIGGVPKSLKAENDNEADYEAINKVYSYMGESGNPGFNLYGNLYCFNQGDNTTYRNGDLVFSNNGTTTINGDLYVEGDIYLCNNSSINVTGGIYVGGNIYKQEWVWDGTLNKNLLKAKLIKDYADHKNDSFKQNNTAVDVTTLKDASKVGNPTRNQKPSMDYDPSSGTTRTMAQVYADATTNDMFLNSQGKKRTTETTGAVTKYVVSSDTKHESSQDLAKLYNDAAKSYPKLTEINTDNAADFDKAYSWAKGLYIDKDCTISLYDAIVDCKSDSNSGNWQSNWQNSYENNAAYDLGSNATLYVKAGYKYDYSKIQGLRLGNYEAFKNSKLTIVFKVTNSSYAVLIPSGTTLNRNEGYETFIIDTSECVGDNFCYFMIYNPNKTDSVGSVDYDDLYGYYYGVDYLNDVAEGKSGLTAPSLDLGTKIKFSERKKDASGHIYDVTDGFVAGTTIDNRVFIMLPDEATFSISGNEGRVNAIIYGMRTNVTVNGSQTRIFGNVYCNKFKGPQDCKQPLINDDPPASNSILSFVAHNIKGASSTTFQYYIKNKK